MIGDNELRRQLIHAAEEFPVHGWPRDVQRRVVRRRRIAAGFALASGAVVAAAVAVAVLMATGSNRGFGGAVPPAATGSADYVGSGWRLTSVTEGASVITIPADVGTRMDLLPDGQILVNDGVNELSGRFTKSAGGFEVHDAASTLAGYAGKDPHRLAAIAALGAVVFGRTGQSGPARDTVVSVGRTRLVVQADAFRLTFARIGPANAAPGLFPTVSPESRVPPR